MTCKAHAGQTQKGQGVAEVGGKRLQTHDFEIVKEERIHSRYLTLFNRTIKFPALQDKPVATNEYDVVGHPQSDFHFTVTFPFHPDNEAPGGGRVTLLREHCQGPNRMMFVLPTGGFDPRKHAGRLECARTELSEEAKLEGGDWHRLLDSSHPGIAEVKWCANRFTPFLCIAPTADRRPGARDPEEFIEVYTIDISELRRLMLSGDMLLPSVATCFLALDRLAALGVLGSGAHAEQP